MKVNLIGEVVETATVTYNWNVFEIKLLKNGSDKNGAKK
jgi:hypothetical protein